MPKRSTRPASAQATRFALREATAAEHARTDATFGRLSLTAAADYALFLAAHHRALCCCLDHVARHWPEGALPARLADDLAADLEALGCGVPAAIPGTPLDGADPRGVAYVVAGSHLGAKVLRKRWGESADPRVQAAGRYLASDDLHAYWPRLLQRLKAVDPGSAAFAGLASAATATFALFIDALAGIEMGESG
ncbi:MAG: biliverdin-producing heme oxygenase [Pseudomonadota bacterium]